MPVCVTILGFHRSGTSALAGAVAALGYKIGAFQNCGSEENPKGFYEHPRLNAINDSLLRQVESAWYDWTFKPGELYAKGVDLNAVQRAAAEFLKTEFAAEPKFLLKDPRMLGLYRFWRDRLEEACVDHVPIFVLRDPTECAHSQVTRARANPDFYEALSTSEATHALWCAYHANFLDQIGDDAPPSCLHADLVLDSAAAIKKISQLVAPGDSDAGDVAAAASQIDPALYRASKGEADGPWARRSASLFQALRAGLVESNGRLTPECIAGCSAPLASLRDALAIADVARPALRARQRVDATHFRIKGEAYESVRELIHIAVNGLEGPSLERTILELEELIASSGHPWLFWGDEAVARARIGDLQGALEVLDRILSTKPISPWPAEYKAQIEGWIKQAENSRTFAATSTEKSGTAVTAEKIDQTRSSLSGLKSGDVKAANPKEKTQQLRTAKATIPKEENADLAFANDQLNPPELKVDTSGRKLRKETSRAVSESPNLTETPSAPSSQSSAPGAEKARKSGEAKARKKTAAVPRKEETGERRAEIERPKKP